VGETEKLPALKVSRLDLLIHLIKVGWREDKGIEK
jgi:hypothetical protein